MCGAERLDDTVLTGETREPQNYSSAQQLCGMKMKHGAKTGRKSEHEIIHFCLCTL